MSIKMVMDMKIFMSMKKLMILALLLFQAALLPSCGDDDQTKEEEYKPVSVTGVSVSVESLTLDIGGTNNLTATVSPTDATNKAVRWSSDNETVATVDRNGKVTAVAEGKTAIVVTTTDGSKTDRCEVTVNPAPPTEAGTIVIPSSTPNIWAGTLESEYADSPMGYGLDKLIDGDTGTHFSTPHRNFHILWSSEEAATPNYYSLTSAADAPESDPLSWILYGSNDNRTWTTLDSRTGQTFAGRGSKLEFKLNNASFTYKYIKLDITNNRTGTSTQIAELSLGFKSEIFEDIDDVMTKAEGRSNSYITPMGNRFENRRTTTDADRVWLATASNEPLASNAGQAQLKAFSVTLFPNGNPIPSDCNQHGIGDCSAIAVFASFAYIYPDFIKDIITDNGDNTYTVEMFDPQGNPVNVAVTNLFPADSGGTIQAVTGKANVACWSTVMEKAMLKWQHLYKVNENIGGIGTEHVAPLFTGNGNSFAFAPGRLTNSELWRAVTHLLREGQLVIGGFNANGTVIGGYSSATTVAGHAYTFMHSATPSALFIMRNPWGGHNGDLPASDDGMIRIPDNSTIPRMIDLRVVEPGKAADYGTGTSSPYTPKTFSPAEMIMRVSPELMRSGR